MNVKLEKKSFSSNVLYVFSGHLIAHFISFFTLPIVTRMYTPKDYGLFSIFMIIATIFGSASTLKFSDALVLPKREPDFRGLVLIALFSVIFVTILSCVIIFLFGGYFLDFFNANSLKEYVYMIPLVVFLGGIGEIIYNWNIRREQFSQTTVIKTFRTAISKVVTIGYGLITKANFTGLLLGELMSIFTAIFLNLRLTTIHKELKYFQVRQIISKDFRRLFLEFIQYPTVILPSIFIAVFSQRLLALFLTFNFTVEYLGLYSFASSLCVPLSMLSMALSPVVFQKFAQTNDKVEMKKMILRIVKWAVPIGVLLFLVLALLGNVIIDILFGYEWKEAGKIIAWLSLMIVFQMLSQITHSYYKVLRRESILLKFEVICLLLGTIALIIGSFQPSPLNMIILYCVVISTSNIFFLSFTINNILK